MDTTLTHNQQPQDLNTMLQILLENTRNLKEALENEWKEREKQEKERQERETKQEKERREWEAKLENERREREAKQEKERQEREAKQEKERQEREAKQEKERQEREAKQEKERREREAKQEKERKEREARWEKEREEQRLLAAERKKKEEEFNAFMKASNARLEKMQSENSSKWGSLVESLCKPAALKLFKERNIGINGIFRENWKATRDKQFEMEIDLLLSGDAVAVALEVKTTCVVEDIDYFLEQMEHFNELYTEFANKKVYVAIAAIKYDQSSDIYAKRHGLFVIRVSGEGVFTMEDPTTSSPKEY